ncbi:NosD domain-containing protein [Candidatus Aenigmatarchaeota archaeon]
MTKRKIKRNKKTEAWNTREVVIGIIFIIVVFSFVAIVPTGEFRVLPGRSTEYIADCGHLTSSGTEYILTKDVESEGTCFVVRANGITLDLNQHTVTYGTGGHYSFDKVWALYEGQFIDETEDAMYPATSNGIGDNGDVYLFADLGDVLYVGSQDTFNFMVLKTSSGTGGSIVPAFEYWDGSAWSPLEGVVDDTNGFDASGGSTRFIGFTIPGDWVQTQVNGEQDGPYYYVRIRRTSATSSEYIGNSITASANFRFGVVSGVSWDKNQFPPDTRFNGGNNFILRNGNIEQGGEGFNNYGAFFFTKDNMEIDNVNFLITGGNPKVIFTEATDHTRIHHNTIQVTGDIVYNRHQSDGSSIFISNGQGASSDVHIYNNELYGSPQGGMTLKSVDSFVYNNYISHDTTVANGYGIQVDRASNVNVYDNEISTDQGRGIHLTGADYCNVYGNTIDIKEGNTPESSWTHGIKLENMELGSTHDPVTYNSVHDNTVTVTTRADGSALGIDMNIIDDDVGNAVYDNEIYAINDNHPNRQATGYKLTVISSVGGDNLEVYGNTIRSNNVFISTGGHAAAHFTAQGDTYEKLSNPINFHSFVWTPNQWGGDFDSIGNVILDATFLGGADRRDILMETVGGSNGNRPAEVFIAWTLNLIVQDTFGQPIENAEVLINDLNEDPVFSGFTNGQGEVTTVLEEFIRWNDENSPDHITEMTPHTITVSKGGFESFVDQIAMDDTKDYVVILDPLLSDFCEFGDEQIPYGTCSVTKPWFCTELGELIKNCQECRCPPNNRCESDGTCTWSSQIEPLVQAPLGDDDGY